MERKARAMLSEAKRLMELTAHPATAHKAKVDLKAALSPTIHF
jgi:hypothetical protein